MYWRAYKTATLTSIQHKFWGGWCQKMAKFCPRSWWMSPNSQTWIIYDWLPQNWRECKFLKHDSYPRHIISVICLGQKINAEIKRTIKSHVLMNDLQYCYEIIQILVFLRTIYFSLNCNICNIRNICTYH